MAFTTVQLAAQINNSRADLEQWANSTPQNQGPMVLAFTTYFNNLQTKIPQDGVIDLSSWATQARRKKSPAFSNGKTCRSNQMFKSLGSITEPEAHKFVQLIANEAFSEFAKNVVHFPKKVITSKCLFYRHTQKAYTFTPGGKIDKEKLPFNNSKKTNRFNGTRPYLVSGLREKFPDLEIDSFNAQAGTYLTNKGKNGIPGAITAEVAHYRGKQNTPPSEHSKSRFDPTLLMTDGDVVVEYETIEPITTIELIDPSTQRAIYEIIYPKYLELALFLNDNNIPTKLKFRDAQHFFDEVIMHPQSYLISQAMGNAFLSQNIALTYNSARSESIPVKEYLEGSYNSVLPLFTSAAIRLTGSYFRRDKEKIERITE
ncbi:hypothetical protein [Pseudomonas fluorescens]|uniref:hypothetical protein n=1 Tax=Pseudomonas fluorescens TaxID=294 RepID=UPI003D219590